jgi:hypothetical protein
MPGDPVECVILPVCGIPHVLPHCESRKQRSASHLLRVAAHWDAANIIFDSVHLGCDSALAAMLLLSMLLFL